MCALASMYANSMCCRALVYLLIVVAIVVGLLLVIPTFSLLDVKRNASF